MKAVIGRELGPPATYRLEDLPARSPGPGELRVGVHYAGVSFVDVLTARGGYQVKPPTPFIPGSEFSGVVLEVGEGVTGFAAGDRIAGGSFGGVFAEEVVMSAASANKVPAGADMAEAAVLRSSFLTAVYALRWRGGLKAGETVLVLGAGGAVGVAAVQVAKAHGARVIASASSEDKRQLALKNGADHAVDSRATDWRDQIKALTGGKGVDVVVDPVGDKYTEPAFRSLGWNGRHLVVGFAAGEIPRLPANLTIVKGASLIGVELRGVATREPETMKILGEEVARLFATGVARPPIARIYPLEDYAQAMHAAASGEAAGRILIRTPAAG
jgi:NADPH2:quinone reductase